MFYFIAPSPDRPGETEVIRSYSPPSINHWNTDNVAVASCLNADMARRIAYLLSTHGEEQQWSGGFSWAGDKPGRPRGSAT